jgi:hypothetical protein
MEHGRSACNVKLRKPKADLRGGQTAADDVHGSQGRDPGPCREAEEQVQSRSRLKSVLSRHSQEMGLVSGECIHSGDAAASGFDPATGIRSVNSSIAAIDENEPVADHWCRPRTTRWTIRTRELGALHLGSKMIMLRELVPEGGEGWFVCTFSGQMGQNPSAHESFTFFVASTRVRTCFSFAGIPSFVLVLIWFFGHAG